MVRASTPIHRRHGFTLIELLIVISIIAVLSALSLAALMRVLGSGTTATAKSEIRELVEALKIAETNFSLRYVPSKLILRRDMTTYNAASPSPITFGTTTIAVTAQEETRSIDTLTSMFGRQVFNQKNQIWTGNSADLTSTSTGWILYGPECLVFFTGGIMSDASLGPVIPLGFSTNKANPTQSGGTRVGPFYPNFKSNRLAPAMYVLNPVTGKSVPTGFFQYQDPFEKGSSQPGQPYAFFSSYGGGSSGQTYTQGNKKLGDCYTLPATSTVANGLQPYFAPSNKLFLNPNGYQIISAGPDLFFGPGGPWNPLVGDSSTVGTSDNLSNFSGSQLSAPQS